MLDTTTHQGTRVPRSLRPDVAEDGQVPTRTLTFDQLHAQVRAFWCEQNAPAAIACRAIETLRAALEGCTVAERADVLALLADEIRHAE